MSILFARPRAPLLAGEYHTRADFQSVGASGSARYILGSLS